MPGKSRPPRILPTCWLNCRLTPERVGARATLRYAGRSEVVLRANAFKRCLGNLVSNAARHATQIDIAGECSEAMLTIVIDDDGPGIPPDKREDVFKPFLRLDDARNQDEGGSGLGLAIARDIARSHGGDVTLGDSPTGGLRAIVKVPV